MSNCACLSLRQQQRPRLGPVPLARSVAFDARPPSAEVDALMGRYRDVIPPDFDKVQEMFGARSEKEPLPQTAAMRVIAKWLEAKQSRTLDNTVRGPPIPRNMSLASGPVGAGRGVGAAAGGSAHPSQLSRWPGAAARRAQPMGVDAGPLPAQAADARV